MSKKQFFIGDLRREINNYIFDNIIPQAKKPLVTLNPSKRQLSKADGMLVKDMVLSNPKVFGHGNYILPRTENSLKSDQILYYHEKYCDTCRMTPSSDCYIHQLLPCISHGWLPYFDREELVPPYSVSGNYKSTDSYSESVNKEILTMLSNNVIRPCVPANGQVINPIGAVVKNSDKARAKAMFDLPLDSQASLDDINAKLLSLGLSKVKVRLTTDNSATGINDAAHSPRFSYPSFKHAVRIMRRHQWLGAVDVGRYFNSFPWAPEMRRLMRFEWCGVLYEYLGLCFGFSVCPYYCSTWSAEFRMWMLAEGRDCAHMVDDWLFIGPDLAHVIRFCETMGEILTNCGFYMASEKNVYGQSIKYLGIVFDTVTMTMRIDSIQAKGTRLLLQSCIDRLRNGYHLPETDIRHLAGKLNWFSEIIQSGRLHIQSWWDYIRHDRHHPVRHQLLSTIILDATWWIGILLRWEENKDSWAQYRILSSDELLQDEQSIFYVQSDASGDDGYGFYYGTYQQTDLKYYGTLWDDDRPFSSHAMEMYSLSTFLSKYGILVRDKILVWISDSTSAVASINKGSCKRPEGRKILSAIFDCCDDLHVELVALWAPRESNILADYLSHLAVLLGRNEIEGNTSDL